MRAELFFDARAQLAEGPVWSDQQQELLWVDILAGRVHRTSSDGVHDSVVDIGEHVGSVVLSVGDDLIVAARSGIRLIDSAAGHPTLATLPDGHGPPGLRMNDGKCDPQGRFVVGTMAYANVTGTGSLWSFDGDRITQILSGVTISNGLAWSEDASILYYVDTPTNRIDAFDYNCETGELSNRRLEIEIPSRMGDPDGLTIDREGGIWVALWGGAALHRYSAGRLDEQVRVPARFVTSCVFGGHGLQDLFVTTAQDPYEGTPGGIYAVRLPVGGRAPERFKGRLPQGTTATTKSQ